LAGARKRLTWRLTTRDRRRIAGRKLTATITATSVDAAGTTRVVDQKVKLR
jgi:hypothetical protein